MNGDDADLSPGVVIIVPNVPPTVTFTFTVTNTSNLTLTNIAVTDNIYGPVCIIPSLAAGLSYTCTVTTRHSWVCTPTSVR